MLPGAIASRVHGAEVAPVIAATIPHTHDVIGLERARAEGEEAPRAREPVRDRVPDHLGSSSPIRAPVTLAHRSRSR
jgi:hypothetical protein